MDAGDEKKDPVLTEANHCSVRPFFTNYTLKLFKENLIIDCIKHCTQI